MKGDSMTNRVFRVKTGDSRARIELKPEEIKLLEELFIHRSLEGRLIHDYYQSSKGLAKNPSHVSTRLTKMVDARLLIRMVDDDDSLMKVNRFHYHYKIGRRGLEVLAQTGFIRKEDIERYYFQIIRLKIPKIHKLATSVIAHQVRVMGMNEGFTEYEHYRGIDDVQEINYKLDQGSIVPDWIFYRGSRWVYLELDTGTENVKKIESKMERYVDLAKKYPTRMISVVFSVADSSLGYSTFYFDSRSKRVATIKGSAPPVHEWPDNLHFYSVCSEDTAPLVLRLLKGIQPVTRSSRQLFIDDWLEHMNQWGRRLTVVENCPSNPKSPRLAWDYIINFESMDATFKVGIIYGEQGSVETYQLMKSFEYRRIHEGEAFGLDYLIVVYPDEEQVHTDVIGETLEYVAFNSLSILKKKDKDKHAHFMKMVSPFKKEGGLFE